jgi:exopolysaccharide production protein ExoQ
LSYYSNNVQTVSDKDESLESRFMSFLAKVSFAVYLFFIFFGTRMPFGEKITDAEDLTSSNIVNQVVFGSLFLISILTLIPKRDELISIIKREKYFFVFLIWCLITVVWSEYSFVSLKRYIQYFTTVSVALSILIYSKNSEETIKFFYYILGLYVIISLATIVAIPGAKDRFGIWRGIAPHKNVLGQASLIAIIFWVYLFKSDSLKIKSIAVALILMTLTILVGSKSSTALFAFIILLLFSTTFITDKFFEPIGIGRTVSSLMIFIAIVLFVSFIVLMPEVIASLLGGTGKDLTLTGRVDLWADIWLETKKHLFLGTGFQGFWVIDSSKLEKLYEIYSWLPIQAHNGYLDIINELGIIGSTLFLLILINFFINVTKLKSRGIWVWFVLAAIIVNFTESTFIRPRLTIGVMFIFAYFAVFRDLVEQENIEMEEETEELQPYNKKLNMYDKNN